MALITLPNDFVGAIAGLYTLALTPLGQAAMLVGAVLLLVFLALDRFVARS